MVHNMAKLYAGNAEASAIAGVFQQLGQPLLTLLAKSSEYLQEC